jgi:hypothetical protein
VFLKIVRNTSRSRITCSPSIGPGYITPSAGHPTVVAAERLETVWFVAR